MESLRGFIGMACFGDHQGSKKPVSLRAVARIRFVRPGLGCSLAESEGRAEQWSNGREEGESKHRRRDDVHA